jgi:hypothetical protein
MDSTQNLISMDISYDQWKALHSLQNKNKKGLRKCHLLSPLLYITITKTLSQKMEYKRNTRRI